MTKFEVFNFEVFNFLLHLSENASHKVAARKLDQKELLVDALED